ncbi:CpxP family protein [Marinomonas transparens]|uniref:CpxP family protein n=1 Tax=Marinomonas transparens TaxID=2795388 RepID=A0A934JSX3_9GAMM|nr:CpxP family protein [Marinomonas transparens]MBJ7539313.1 CpxP family protein [Marinomonas transparens]
MKMIKKVVLAVVVLPIAIGTASAFAFGGNGHHKGPQDEFRMGFDRSIMHDLDLTREQKDQLKSLRKASKSDRKTSFKGNFQANQAKRQSLRQKMNELLLADDFDSAKATELTKEMTEIKMTRQVAMLEKQHEMLSILTPEQKVKFTELQKERTDKWAEKMQRRMDKHND